MVYFLYRWNMAKRKEVEKSMLGVVSQRIKNDNKTVDELIDKIMKEVEVWVKDHKKDWDELSIEDQSTLTEPTYLVRKVAEIKYAKSSLRDIIIKNLNRAPGNLNEEQRMMGLYETLSNFDYKCPYSYTLLIGSDQKIHIDHIIPVSMGGPTDDWNCIPVCESCNTSKGNKHLLDWWEENRTQKEEYKLVKIFEHMTSKLLDETNEIHYLETENETNRLDVISFLNQLYEHIEENKEYIVDCEFENEKEKTKAIVKKLKELKSTLEKVTKKNNKNTKTDKQHFAEMREMVRFVKSLGARNYYKIAYTYFTEIQEMQILGKTDKEIREFCFERDDVFNFTLFYEKLIAYKEKHGGFAGVTRDKEIGRNVGNVRLAYKGKGHTKLTCEMIDKLNAIGFPWEAEYGKWFNVFYEKLVSYKEKKGSFFGATYDDEIGIVVTRVRQAYQGRGRTKLTTEMIDSLNAIGFPWEAEYGEWFDVFYEKLIVFKEKNGNFDNLVQDKDIGKTVSNVRQAKKHSDVIRLTSEMIDKLNEIGFPWEVDLTQKHAQWFSDFYNKLIEYKEKKGGFSGITQDKEIGSSVRGIRRAYKGKGTYKLTSEMIDRLNVIGFPWEADLIENQGQWFDPFYKKLLKYKEKKGSFIGVTNDQEIGDIVSKVRKSYKGKGTYKLTQEMIDKLNAIGFPWEARPKKAQEDNLSV